MSKELVRVSMVGLIVGALGAGCTAGAGPAGGGDALVLDARDDQQGIYAGHFLDGHSGIEVSFRIDLSGTVSYELATADAPDLVLVELADRTRPELASVTIAGADVT